MTFGPGGKKDGPGRRKGVSLSLRIWLVFSVVNVITVLGTLATTWYVSRQSVEQRAAEQVEQQVTNIQREYRSEIVDQLQYHVNLLAGLPTVDEMLRASDTERFLLIDRMYRQFALITENMEGYGAVSYVMNDGALGLHLENKKRVRKRHDLSRPAETQPNQTLAAMAQIFETLKNQPLLLSSGNMEWFMPPRSMVSSGIIRNENGEPAIVVGLAKLDVDIGAFGGAVLIRYDLKSFIDRLADVHVLGAGGVWLQDDNGQIFLKPDDFEKGPQPELLLGETRLLRNLTEVVPAGVTGTGILSVTRYAPPLRMAITVPSSAFSSELDPLFLVFAATVLASALLFGVVAIVASRGLTQPIRALSVAASRIADGDFTARAGSSSGGEIGELEESFDQMTEKLQSAIRSREKSMQRLMEQKLEQERLIRARIEAEASARASSEFLAHMSHELRTPLNSIIGFTDLISKKLFGPLGSPKYDEYISDVSYSANHLLGLIGDILDLSKIEAGQMEAERAPFAVPDLLQECAVIARPAARQDLAAISISEQAELPDLVADRRMMRQVMINLLSNAVKFTPVEGRIRAEVVALPDGGLEISVTDTGEGIPENQIDHVLQPFGQARTSSGVAHHSGTGLGLPLSRRLTELNGGTLALRSVEGVGTTITLTFPPTRVSDGGMDNVVSLATSKMRA